MLKNFIFLPSKNKFILQIEFATCVNKRKVKIFPNISVIFDFEFQTGAKKQKDCNFKTEGHCYHGDPSLPNKRLTNEKCFVHPEVDSNVKPNFKALNGFRRSFILRNRIHLKLLRKLYSFLGSLT